MEAREVREIMEAYASMYSQVIAEAECEDEEESEEEETPKMNGKKKEKKEKEEKEDEMEMKEGVDLFDYLLEYLVAEGYADTNKAALAIMANMSEEWREEIVEGYGLDPKFGSMRKRGGRSAPPEERSIGGERNRSNKDYWADVQGKNRDRGSGNKAKRRAAELG